MRRSWMMIAVGLLVAVFAIGAVACDDDDDGNGAEATATAEDGAGAPTATTEADGDEPTATAEPADGAGATVIVTENATLGAILTDAEGNTVYVFANDTEGVSNCVDACTDVWPPLTADGTPTGGEGVTGTLATIERADGTTQVTYDGAPLYRYVNDAAPGDTNGDGVAGVWSVVSVE